MTVTAQVDSRFRLTEDQAHSLTKFGTPLYVVGEVHFRERIRAYRAAFTAAFPKSELTYASKANSLIALLEIAHEEGCLIDVASEGEFRAALAAGVPPADCHLHGNNKSETELRFAVSQGIGQIVVDNFDEIETLASMVEGDRTQLVLRLAPGVDPVTHAKISTGQADTKFGFNIADGSAERATLRMLELGLPLTGFHCHVGSQLLDPEAQKSGGSLIASFAVKMWKLHQFRAEYLNLGGGLGVTYVEGESPMRIDEYCQLVVQAVLSSLNGSGLNPVLAQEPGRALVAESGVTIYEVGSVKTVPAKDAAYRTYVVVDGGLSDNPRPALYGSRYTVERVAKGASQPRWKYLADGPGGLDFGEPSSERTLSSDGRYLIATVSGKHCETDRLFPDVLLPADIEKGDLLQVLCTGAYNASMASNYNRFLRPACVLIQSDGSPKLIQRRETWDDLFARETKVSGTSNL